MLTTLVLALTLAQQPDQVALDRAWEQVQIGASILTAAVERAPAIAAASRVEVEAAEESAATPFEETLVTADPADIAATMLVLGLVGDTQSIDGGVNDGGANKEK